MGNIAILACVLFATGIPTVSAAAESITYTYDSRGRLVRVAHAGTVNNGAQTEYSHDKATNRIKVKIIGAANSFEAVRKPESTAPDVGRPASE